MAATTFDLEIYFEDKDDPIKVRADQRDISAFELEYKVGFTNALDQMPITFFRFLGWSVMKRKGQVAEDIGRETWLKTVVAVEPEDDEPVNPGQPAAQDEPSSISA